MYQYKAIGHSNFFSFVKALQDYYNDGWEPFDRTIANNSFWFQTIRKKI